MVVLTRGIGGTGRQRQRVTATIANAARNAARLSLGIPLKTVAQAAIDVQLEKVK